MSATDPYAYYSVENYSIRQLVPVTGYVAVIALENGDDTYSLHPIPLDFLAVALVTTTRYKRLKERNGLNSIKLDESTRWDVAAVEFCDGYLNVLNEASNFAGICKVGDKIDEITGCLESDYRSKLKPTNIDQPPHVGIM